MSYYNTTRESGATLARSESRAKTQEERLLAFFERHPDVWYTNHGLWNLANQRVPITSIQRCLTNLTNAGKLEKSENADWRSDYGKQVHAWRLAQREG